MNEPKSIVMTESAAKKYFGTEDPMGKIVDFNKKMQLKVTGIAADVPVNSHLDFDMIVPITNWRNEGWFNQWPNNGMFAYVQLNPNVMLHNLKNRCQALWINTWASFIKKVDLKWGLP